MLTDVPSINQKQLKNIMKFSIRSGGNLLILGPSGAGKTFIGHEAASEENCRLIYVNLAVLERTDFQGFPVISDDKTLVSYATPEFLPFADTATKDELSAIRGFLNSIEGESDEQLSSWAKKRIDVLEKKQRAQAIVKASSWVNSSGNDKLITRFNSILDNANKILGDETPCVVMFDEADKAITETMQTLLEFLQFGSINARKLNVRANILTGNLPDEHAHVNQISHAISKRCKTFKLGIEFNQWREWAFNNNVHDHIIQYLSSEPTMIYKTAPDNDPTAYAMPSPRTWTDASKALSFIDNDSELSKMPTEKLLEFRSKLIAGCVGETASIKFDNWYTFYRRFDPFIHDLVENNVHPNVSKLSAQELLIMAISSCSKVYAELKPKNEKRIEKVTKNVYSWMKKLPPDAQIGAIRLSFGGDWDKCHKYGMGNITEFKEVFRDVKSKMESYDADLSPRKIEKEDK